MVYNFSAQKARIYPFTETTWVIKVYN